MRKFINGQKYIHAVKQTDLYIEVVKVQYADEKCAKLKVRYVRKKDGEYQYCGKGADGFTDHVTIRGEHYDDWTLVPQSPFPVPPAHRREEIAQPLGLE